MPPFWVQCVRTRAFCPRHPWQGPCRSPIQIRLNIDFAERRKKAPGEVCRAGRRQPAEIAAQREKIADASPANNSTLRKTNRTFPGKFCVKKVCLAQSYAECATRVPKQKERRLRAALSRFDMI